MQYKVMLATQTHNYVIRIKVFEQQDITKEGENCSKDLNSSEWIH